jgi:ATP-dependent metalloprotease FtsH
MLSGQPARGKRPRRKREKKSALGLWFGAAILLLVAAFLGVLELSRPHVTGDELRFDTWYGLVEGGKIKNAHILDEDSIVVGTYERADGTEAPYNAPLIRGIQGQLVLEHLIQNKVAITVDQQVKKRVANLAAFLLPGLVIILLFLYLILSSRRGTGLFKVKSGARKIEAEPGSATFADVAGQDAAVLELREIRDYLTNAGRYDALGAQIPKGVLLYGPPGCGKTLMAEALAGEARASFYSISGSDFVELYVGVGAARVRDLFNQARDNAPAVIFIDEVDSIGRARSTGGDSGGGNSEQEQALNQLLAEMDGFSTSDGIIVVAATNRPDILDPALLRPGRFDRTIALERPDEAARVAILSLHARGKRFDAGVDLAAVARKAVGLTGADLASVMNEGALLAARAGKSSIGQEQLLSGLNRILEAPDRQRRLSLTGKSVGRRIAEGDKVSFADVAGQDQAIKELREIKDFLADPDRYAALGARVPRGILLYGPPGCGKTLLGKALASETNAAFFSVTASDFASSFVGQGATRVREVFAEAKQMAPAIVFIDEIDTLGRTRVIGRGDSGGQEDEQALNQLLTEMDGFGSTDGVLVIGATNRPDVLDPALLRPGRFDRSVALELPDAKARLAILSLHAVDKSLDPSIRLEAVAEKAHGLTGADLANIMNEAALFAVRAGRQSISQAELDLALEQTIQAPDRQRRLSLRSASVGRRYGGSDRITFDDVAGVDDAIVELQDIKRYLADPSVFVQHGVVPPKGILLSGPPGCGKTLLARALAGEANAGFLSVSATDFVEVYVGVGAARIRDLFAEARSIAPAIVFIDEIDAIGARRSAFGDGAARETENSLNQLLTELDGFDKKAGVIVVAATNRPDMLDSALVRPGRFDRRVQITMPDRKGRLDILKLHAKGRLIDPEVDLDVIAARTRGMAGADLNNILNEAGLLASRIGPDQPITRQLLDEAFDRAWAGIGGSRTVMTDEERLVVAYHEAGHAIVALATEGADVPHKLTILPTGGSLGHLRLVDTHDRHVYTRSRYIAMMAVSFGGWASEKLVFGEVGSGAAGDLERVNAIARSMVVDWGMSDLGPMAANLAGDLDEGPGTEEARAAIRALGDEAHGKAHAVLTTHRAALDAIAQTLLERETLGEDDLREIFERSQPANGARQPAAASAVRVSSPS